MVEALVALVVMTTGMLGVAGLYVASLKASRTAQYRTVATALAADLADQIRANRTAGVAYANNAPTAKPCFIGAANCSPADMAEADLFVWRQRVAAQLPNAIGSVAFTAGTPQDFIITVQWDEPNEDGTALVQIFRTTVQI
jgi:type IV pilus assembly protein PilV